jgi:hypothetical protein
MDTLETPASSPIFDIAVQITIWISEVVFQWIPATVSVLIGVEVGGEPDAPATPPGGGIPLPGVDVSSDPLGDLPGIWGDVTPYLIFISLVLLTGIIYSTIRLWQIRRHETAVLRAIEHPIAAGSSTGAHLRWSSIVEQASSDNPADWRLAILEADIMLDELLDVQGYHGDTTGEKMKQVERSDFNTIDAAWEAHKLRNEIAHQGSARNLNQREVRRAIDLYEKVFREFSFI